MDPKPPAGLVQRPEHLFRRTRRNVRYALASISRNLLIQFTVCLFLIGLHLLLLGTPHLERFEYIFLDLFFKQRPVLTTHPAIAYIEIAEDSIQSIGRWPWPRQYHAVLIHILKEWKAKCIVFDVLFSEPSRSFDDGALREALGTAKDFVYFPVVLEASGEGKKWIQPLPKFEKRARGIGHINIEPDRDGTLRRIHLYEKYSKESYPNLAFRVAYDYLAKPLPPPERLPFALDSKGNLLVNWSGKWEQTFEHYSYVDLLRSYEAVSRGKKPLIDPEKLRDKICLIGLTAFGHADIKANPLEASYPAVGVHANVINSILTRQFVRTAPPRMNAFCLVAIGLAASLLFVLFRNVASFMAGLLLGVVWVLFAFVLFWKGGVWLYVMHPLVLILSLFIFSTAYALVLGKKELSYLFQLATRDGLTGLYVIRHFRNILNQAVTEAHAKKKPLSIILLDIDHFKKINDTHGHPAGDSVLKDTARILHGLVRQKRPLLERDCVGRYGGEEFIIMLRNCKLSQAAVNVAERIRKKVEQTPFFWKGRQIPVTVSLGVATLHPDETVPDPVVHRADEALYQAKESGRNRTGIEKTD